MSYPKVGIGVILVNKNGRILVGKRIGSHAPYYSIPGGHLEEGETFEAAACREIAEETSIRLTKYEVFSLSNNLETYKNEGLHYISIGIIATEFSGEPHLMEPHKCEAWRWVDPRDLPKPHFEASEQLIQCYLNNTFYLPNE